MTAEKTIKASKKLSLKIKVRFTCRRTPCRNNAIEKQLKFNQNRIRTTAINEASCVSWITSHSY